MYAVLSLGVNSLPIFILDEENQPRYRREYALKLAERATVATTFTADYRNRRIRDWEQVAARFRTSQVKQPPPPSRPTPSSATSGGPSSVSRASSVTRASRPAATPSPPRWAR